MTRVVLFAASLTLLAPPLYAQRLPVGVSPVAYRLTFAPDFTKDNFTGEQTIQVRVAKRTTRVTLNALELEIHEARITQGGRTQSAKISMDADKQQATFTVPRPLAAGRAQIATKFTGILNDKLAGFYLSQTKTRKYAVTQLEATDARRAFPCFDEPAYKATFDVSIVADKGDVAISNAPQVSDTPGPGAGKHTIRFAPTKKMSSYLVAMLVGDFRCIEGRAEGIPLRICAAPGKEQMGRFALEATAAFITYFNQYYGIKYPFEKLDQIALADFSAGAMENTGAITYRESLLLIDEKTASQSQKRTVAGIIAHEIAHQWFGNLVTMKWWDDLWLNEGFATWMASKPVHAWKPEWNVPLDDVHETGGSLGLDALAATRPIRTSEADTPAQIQQLFDGIAYGKAAAVLRMVETFVGPEVFRTGVNRYLADHAYGNARAEDLWNAVAKASGKPVDAIMGSFVNQPGAPLLNVEAACRGGTTTVTVAQQRFFRDRALLDKGSPERWQVPVCFKAPGLKEPSCHIITERTQEVQVPGCGDWLFANAEGGGYYRTSYTDGMVQALASRVTSVLAPGERIAFLSDEWALVSVGRHKIGTYLMLVEGFKQERSRAVAQSAFSRLNQIGGDIVAERDRPAYQAWVRNLLQPLVQDLGMEAPAGDSDERRLLRTTVLGLMAFTAKDPEVIAQAKRWADTYLQDPASVDPQMAGLALGVAVEHGDAALYDRLREKMKTASNAVEYNRYLFGLTAFEDEALIKRTLEFTLSPDLRTQDLLQVIGSMLSNPKARAHTWAFLKAHFDELQARLGTGLGPGLVNVTGTFCDAKQRDEARDFFMNKNLPGAERTLRQGFERATACIELKERQQAHLSEWLKGRRTQESKASLLAIFAHPDDETTVGPLLARYAGEGHPVHVVTITSGQKGSTPHAGMPAGEELGKAREQEMRCAAGKLGVSDLTLLQFHDQGISDPQNLDAAAARVREKINQLKPDVIITWGPEGMTGHPDHRAASSITTQVFQQRARLEHKPRKLYYVAYPESRFRHPTPPFDRHPLRTVADEFVTTAIDTRKSMDAAFAAIECHKTQWTPERMAQMKSLGETVLDGRVFLRLALSDAPRPAGRESDIFHGLR